MPKREHPYRIALDAPAPEDLAQRCAATWCELLDVIEHARQDAQGQTELVNSERPAAASERGAEEADSAVGITPQA